MKYKMTIRIILSPIVAIVTFGSWLLVPLMPVIGILIIIGGFFSLTSDKSEFKDTLETGIEFIFLPLICTYFWVLTGNYFGD